MLCYDVSGSVIGLQAGFFVAITARYTMYSTGFWGLTWGLFNIVVVGVISCRKGLPYIEYYKSAG